MHLLLGCWSGCGRMHPHRRDRPARLPARQPARGYRLGLAAGAAVQCLGGRQHRLRSPGASQSGIEVAPRPAARAPKLHGGAAGGVRHYGRRPGRCACPGSQRHASPWRALLKDPPVLVLDEATAMFDPAGEAEFGAAAKTLRERTVILMTHRPANLALADRILRMGRGLCDRPDAGIVSVGFPCSDRWAGSAQKQGRACSGDSIRRRRWRRSR